MFHRYTALIALLLFSRAALAQEFPNHVILTEVHYQGLSLFTPLEVTTVAGLKIGQPVTAADLEAAAARLSYWGYFKSVQFLYRYLGTRLTVTFVVEEGAPRVRCSFDNFVGFTDQALLDAIHREFPSFDGMLPAAGTIREQIASILEEYLNREGDPYHVGFTHFMASGAPSQSPVPQAVVYSVTDPPISVCRASFEGDSEEAAAILQKAAVTFMQRPFSRTEMETTHKTAMNTLMRGQGYWRFDLRGIAAEKFDSPECPRGAHVRLSFQSGSRYSLGNVIWAGNVERSVEELNLLLGMASGEAAGQDRFEAGMTNVANAYRKNGFYDYRLLQSRPTVDTSNLRVHYRIELHEGPQFRMGRLINLFGEDPSIPFDKLAGQWRLKEGAPFDALYFEEFVEKSFKPWLATYAPKTDLVLSGSADRNNRIVNILLIRPFRKAQAPAKS